MKRIRELIGRYHSLREEVMKLQHLAEISAKKLVDDPAIQALSNNLTKIPSEWINPAANDTTPVESQQVTLSQLETALEAKWKSLSLNWRRC